jgi:CHASE2 domain-containing sensor protein
MVATVQSMVRVPIFKRGLGVAAIGHIIACVPIFIVGWWMTIIGQNIVSLPAIKLIIGDKKCDA